MYNYRVLTLRMEEYATTFESLALRMEEYAQNSRSCTKFPIQSLIHYDSMTFLPSFLHTPVDLLLIFTYSCRSLALIEFKFR